MSRFQMVSGETTRRHYGVVLRPVPRASQGHKHTSTPGDTATPPPGLAEGPGLSLAVVLLPGQTRNAACGPGPAASTGDPEPLSQQELVSRMGHDAPCPAALVVIRVGPVTVDREQNQRVAVREAAPRQQPGRASASSRNGSLRSRRAKKYTPLLPAPSRPSGPTGRHAGGPLRQSRRRPAAPTRVTN
jgi:hypothetical protein